MNPEIWTVGSQIMSVAIRIAPLNLVYANYRQSYNIHDAQLKVCLRMIFERPTYQRFDLHDSRTKERLHLMMAGIVKMKDGSTKDHVSHRHCLSMCEMVEQNSRTPHEVIKFADEYRKI